MSAITVVSATAVVACSVKVKGESLHPGIYFQ